MAIPGPGVGEWYRLPGAVPFEVVAVDDDDGTVEVQYADGTVEEIDLADWCAWADHGELTSADPSEDWSDAADVEADEGRVRAEGYGEEHERGGWSAGGGLDGIDLFEAG